jgi:alanine racemase
MPVVKANAYGHGLSCVVKALEMCPVPFFAVDSVEEARVIREVNARLPVLLLGYIPRRQLREVIEAGWSFVCSKDEMLAWVGDMASSACPAKVHLEVETGLYRQGADEPELARMLSRLETLRDRVVVEGVCSHFASAENVEDQSSAEEQEARFWALCHHVEAAGHAPRWRHIACSAAIWLRTSERFDAVRLGISLYGIWSSAGVAEMAPQRHHALVLKSVLTWKTLVAERKTIPAGAAVGYNGTERVSRMTQLAVLPVGYADGFDRRLSSCGEVLVRGHRARVIGRVCMNMCMVDVTDIPGVEIEDEVVLYGVQEGARVSPEDTERQLTNFIAYEAVAQLQASIPRVLV